MATLAEMRSRAEELRLKGYGRTASEQAEYDTLLRTTSQAELAENRQRISEMRAKTPEHYPEGIDYVQPNQTPRRPIPKSMAPSTLTKSQQNLLGIARQTGYGGQIGERARALEQPPAAGRPQTGSSSQPVYLSATEQNILETAHATGYKGQIGERARAIEEQYKGRTLIYTAGAVPKGVSTDGEITRTFRPGQSANALLGQWVQQGLITDTGDNTYKITDKGKGLGKDKLYAMEQSSIMGKDFDILVDDNGNISVLPEGTRKAMSASGTDEPYFIDYQGKTYLLSAPGGTGTVQALPFDEKSYSYGAAQDLDISVLYNQSLQTAPKSMAFSPSKGFYAEGYQTPVGATFTLKIEDGQGIITTEGGKSYSDFYSTKPPSDGGMPPSAWGKVRTKAEYDSYVPGLQVALDPRQGGKWRDYSYAAKLTRASGKPASILASNPQYKFKYAAYRHGSVQPSTMTKSMFSATGGWTQKQRAAYSLGAKPVPYVWPAGAPLPGSTPKPIKSLEEFSRRKEYPYTPLKGFMSQPDTLVEAQPFVEAMPPGIKQVMGGSKWLLEHAVVAPAKFAAGTAGFAQAVDVGIREQMSRHDLMFKPSKKEKEEALWNLAYGSPGWIQLPEYTTIAVAAALAPGIGAVQYEAKKVIGIDKRISGKSISREVYREGTQAYQTELAKQGIYYAPVRGDTYMTLSGSKALATQAAWKPISTPVGSASVMRGVPMGQTGTFIYNLGYIDMPKEMFRTSVGGALKWAGVGAGAQLASNVLTGKNPTYQVTEAGIGGMLGYTAGMAVLKAASLPRKAPTSRIVTMPGPFNEGHVPGTYSYPNEIVPSGGAYSLKPYTGAWRYTMPNEFSGIIPIAPGTSKLSTTYALKPYQRGIQPGPKLPPQTYMLPKPPQVPPKAYHAPWDSTFTGRKTGLPYKPKTDRTPYKPPSKAGKLWGSGKPLTGTGREITTGKQLSRELAKKKKGPFEIVVKETYDWDYEYTQYPGGVVGVRKETPTLREKQYLECAEDAGLIYRPRGMLEPLTGITSLTRAWQGNALVPQSKTSLKPIITQQLTSLQSTRPVALPRLINVQMPGTNIVWTPIWITDIVPAYVPQPGIGITIQEPPPPSPPPPEVPGFPGPVPGGGITPGGGLESAARKGKRRAIGPEKGYKPSLTGVTFGIRQRKKPVLDIIFTGAEVRGII